MNNPRILIVGAVAGGATAAARARRIDENAQITLLDRGPYVSFANCGLPYFISRDIVKRSSLLLQTPEGFFGRYKVDVRLRTEAVAIDRERKVVLARGPAGEEEFPYDKLILAQGGNPIAPALPGANLDHVFQLWNIPHMDRIHKYIEEKKPTHAVVVGGGFIGLEMAEALRARGVAVNLVELAPQVLVAMDPEFGAMAENAMRENQVGVVTGGGLKAIAEHEVHLDDGRVLPADLVLLSIGVRPELELVKQAGLELGALGGLKVDEFLRTSDANIYAAGDMVEVEHRVHGKQVRMPLAGPANRQGRIAATNSLGGNMKYRGVLGTAVVKLFGYTAAFTGLSEKGARAAGFDTGVSYVFKDHHASYYPGAKPLALKLVFDLRGGRLLGAQAFGQEGVEKRIDVLATALHGKMTLEELTELDLSYAPPYSSANDPVNMAAFVGLNHLNGFSPLKTPAEVLADLHGGTGRILDVRTLGEQSKAPLASAVHIPADEVRDRLDDVPRGQPLYILSKDGFLGHLVLRILRAHGYPEVYNISGGFATARWISGWKFGI